MKQKLEGHKGITLIALIITIIVLLILAVVAINAIKGDGIIAHAKNAKSQYSEAQTNEQKVLSDYELMLEQEAGNAWKQDKTKVTKGDVTLEVGDTITNFKAGNKTWKVLGEENGKLLLMSTDNIVASKTISGDDTTLGVWDEATASYKNAEDALNKECIDNITLTAEEQTQVSEIRSIKLKDLDRIVDYNPETAENGKPYNAGKLNQYGNKVTWSMEWDETIYAMMLKYESKVKSATLNYEQFLAPGTKNDITTPYTVINTYYNYEMSRKLDKNSKAYQMLFEDTYNNGYWIGSSFSYATDDKDYGYAMFGLYFVWSNNWSMAPLWQANRGSAGQYGWGVRPVVSLKSDVKLTKSGDNSWSISNS